MVLWDVTPMPLKFAPLSKMTMLTNKIPARAAATWGTMAVSWSRWNSETCAVLLHWCNCVLVYSSLNRAVTSANTEALRKSFSRAQMVLKITTMTFPFGWCWARITGVFFRVLLLAYDRLDVNKWPKVIALSADRRQVQQRCPRFTRWTVWLFTVYCGLWWMRNHALCAGLWWLQYWLRRSQRLLHPRPPRPRHYQRDAEMDECR